MDPIESLDISKDTTCSLILEGLRRGYAISIFYDKDVFIHNGNISCNMRSIAIVKDEIKIKCIQKELVSSYDILLMRKDPPFDMRFTTVTATLAMIESELIAINTPSGILSFPEKLWPATFKQFHPPTLVSANREDLLDFKREHGAIVLKPLYEFCGSGVYISFPNDRNFNSVLDIHLNKDGLPIVAQKYLPNAKNGDRRIIMLGGVAVGALNRTAKPNDHRCNMFVGGAASIHDLSDVEKSLCETIGPWLVERGLHFVGIDVIDNYITEINTTSPTGLTKFRDLGGADLAIYFWEYAVGLLNAS
jgi:glutathione synthase